MNRIKFCTNHVSEKAKTAFRAVKKCVKQIRNQKRYPDEIDSELKSFLQSRIVLDTFAANKNE